MTGEYYLPMAGLFIYRGNRLEALLDPLAARIAQSGPGRDLFQSETIVVQGRGMVPYVQRQLAERHGVAANLKFPYPNRLLRDLFTLVSPRPFPFDIHWLTWRIMTLLPDMLERPEFAGLARYIMKENKSRRMYRLCRQIADIFDQYIIHRPGMIADWSRETPPAAPDGQAWQIHLWRALFPGQRPDVNGMLAAADPNAELNPVILKERLISAVPDEALRSLLPRRLILFGIATLPELHREVFLHLAGRLDLFLFALETGPAGIDRQNRAHAEPASASGTAGILTPSTFADELITEARTRNISVQEESLFERPRNDSLPGWIQTKLFDGPGVPVAEPPRESDSADRAIHLGVHSCHSPLREVEVLYNYLLDLFQRRPELTPADVLIVAPGADTYAPLVQAVFAGSGDTTPALPVRTLGWHPSRAAGRDALLRIWKLLRGRFRAEELLEVLELPAVQERLGLLPAEVALIRTMVEKAGVRWGLDADHRERLDLPGTTEHTWRFGLDRLVLGYALPETEEIFEIDGGFVLPVDALEGESALLFARFLEFVQACADFAQRLETPHSLGDWAALLREISDLFLAEKYRAELDEAFGRWSETALDPGYPGLLDAEAVPAILGDLSDDPAFVRGASGTAVTFASLLPARELPFAVVCMLGMNQDDFPSRPLQTSFDLLEEKRDYRRREEIRLFQEHLLSARSELFFSYVGRNIYNNRASQPSPLLAELLELLSDCGVPRDRYFHEHRLQPFHPHYFRGDTEAAATTPPGLYSYIESHLAASRALLKENVPPRGLFADSGPAAGRPDEPRPDAATPEELPLAELLNFFRSPAEYFLRHRLRLNPGELSRLIPDAEPFQLDHRDAYRLKRGLVERLLEEDPDPALFEDARSGPLFERYFRKIRAAGLLPHGAPGEVLFRAHFQEAVSFFADMQSRVDTRRIVRLRFASPETGRFREVLFSEANEPVALTGRLPADKQGLLLFRPALLKGQDLLNAWIRHLVLNLTAGGNAETETLFVARPTPPGHGPRSERQETNASNVTLYRLTSLDPASNLQRREKAREILGDLLSLLDEGRRRPLPFFPETSRAYFRVRSESGEESFALKEARMQWHSVRPGVEQGEFTYPAVNLCFAHREPVHSDSAEHEAFRALAVRVYGPIMQYLREEN